MFQSKIYACSAGSRFQSSSQSMNSPTHLCQAIAYWFTVDELWQCFLYGAYIIPADSPPHC